MNGTTIFFDTETGGVEPHHPTIQLAAIAVDPSWHEVESVEVKLEFIPGECDPEALEMNHFDPAVWAAEAMNTESARAYLTPFFERHSTWELISRKGNRYKNARLAGHNAATFDAPRLVKIWGDKYPPFAWFYTLDTQQLALWRFSTRDVRQPRDFKLGTLCKHYGIDATGAHDALSDVRMTIQLAKKLLGVKG